MSDLSSPFVLLDLSRCAFNDLSRAGKGDPLLGVFGDLLLDDLVDLPRGDSGESLLFIDLEDLSFSPFGDVLLDARGDLLLVVFGTLGEISTDLGDLLREAFGALGVFSFDSF